MADLHGWLCTLKLPAADHLAQYKQGGSKLTHWHFHTHTHTHMNLSYSWLLGYYDLDQSNAADCPTPPSPKKCPPPPNSFCWQKLTLGVHQLHNSHHGPLLIMCAASCQRLKRRRNTHTHLIFHCASWLKWTSDKKSRKPCRYKKLHKKW